MPRSLRRRVELLEGRPPPRPAAVSREELIAWFGRLAADPTGLPPGPAAALVAAWAEYAAAREAALAAAPEEPPAWYRPGLPPASRHSEWRDWDHPRVSGAVDKMLDVVVELDEARRAAGPPV